MNKLLFVFSVVIYSINANAFSLPKSLENKYCIDEACLFTPIDKIPQNLISSNSNNAKEIKRVGSRFPICDGIGGGSFDAVSSKGKALWIGLNAFPEIKGNHARLGHIRATVPGSYSKEQMQSIFYDLVKRHDFPKARVVNRGSNMSAAKPDSGQEIILTASADSDGLVIEFSMNYGYIELNDFRKMPECVSVLPKF